MTFFCRVTIVKDKVTRLSKGVAFVLFLDKESAHNCARAVNSKQVGSARAGGSKADGQCQGCK